MPPTNPPDLFEALHGLMHAYRAQWMPLIEAASPGLTPNAVRALMYVGRHPGATQKDLVRHSGADKAQVARMLALLEEQGLLERAPSAGDKRSLCLALSAEGAALHETLRATRRKLSANLLRNFPASEQAQLRALLERLRQSVDAASGAAEPSDSSGRRT